MRNTYEKNSKTCISTVKKLVIIFSEFIIDFLIVN
jgi:hypothetical protein